MKLYFVGMFILMAAFFLAIGVKVVSSKRPMLVPARIFFVFMALAFSPQLVNFFSMVGSEAGKRMGFILYLNPIMFICLLVFFWIQMKGYVAIGIYDETFRNSLHGSLNKNNIVFEEQLSVVKLISENANLQVAIQSWVGTGQLRLKKSNDAELLKRIVAGMNDYFIEHDIKSNNTTAIFYIIMGVFMVIAAGSFGVII
ncbi:hypothetical protein GCM10011613_14850 [Cellvibrio zantedeschiae]|uniref:Uncharacterized protein n=1 Tax=Cellvibrio zantedeschiae TaxID=1237077 RepID=A0ABQ3AZE4_9GAMM|nr:hypothetical protein [Cellvibrio zantedeschiae]GGY71233.1 hypothetical protein GCM10011613_14850 [Cellvibrio zantedeschiae]